MSQGSVVIILKRSGQDYKNLNQIFSRCCTPNVIKVGTPTQKVLKSQLFKNGDVFDTLALFSTLPVSSTITFPVLSRSTSLLRPISDNSPSLPRPPSHPRAQDLENGMSTQPTIHRSLCIFDLSSCNCDATANWPPHDFCAYRCRPSSPQVQNRKPPYSKLWHMLPGSCVESESHGSCTAVA